MLLLHHLIYMVLVLPSAHAGDPSSEYDPEKVLECTGHGPRDAKCKIMDIRLADGEYENAGRIEVKINGVWGDICSDDWDWDDADVACRMLGFDGVLNDMNDSEFGRGDGPVWMNRVQCTGKEKSLSDCIYQGLPIYDCDEEDDIASAECIPNDPQEEVELQFGESNKEGTVFIKRDGIWGTICDDDWGIDEANVVCRMLGFVRAVDAPKYSHFGEGEGPIWLDEVNCPIDETHISRCEHEMWGDHDCGHDEDVGVICVDEEDTCSTNEECNEGVCGVASGECGCDPGRCGERCESEDCEIPDCVNGRWFDGFLGEECRCTGHFGLNSDGLCTVEGGSSCDPPCKAGLGYCKLPRNNDDHTQCDCVEGVEDCREESTDTVKLVGGLSPAQGTVEIYHDGKWRAICDDIWDIHDANVICRMLGYERALAAVHDAYFGECECGYWLDEVRCTEDDEHIADCIHAGWGEHDCRDGEAAGVVCAMPCDYHPCKNKGMCKNLSKESYECKCTPSFKGPTCEEPC